MTITKEQFTTLLATLTDEQKAQLKTLLEPTPEPRPVRDRAEGSQFYEYVTSGGLVKCQYERNNRTDSRRHEFGNYFLLGTDSAARQALRLMARQPQMREPEIGQDVWFWSYSLKRADSMKWAGEPLLRAAFMAGELHPTEDACNAWGEKYHDALTTIDPEVGGGK